MTKKLRFAIFGNVYQDKKSLAIQKLLSLLEERQADILIDKVFYEHLKAGLHLDIHPTELITDDHFTADVAVSMGGDGTFLQAASRVGNKQIPILGINMGRLGFLADITADEIDTIIEEIYTGHYRIEERSVLQVTFGGLNCPQGYPFALNEIAVLKRDNSSMISIRICINDEYLTTYQADGLIVNTPTGSTGYALSVGGPILTPGSNTIGLVPVAPHSLNVRPLTLRDDMEVKLSVESRSHQFLVAIDGRSETCAEDVQLTISKAPYHICVLKRPHSSFFRTLRNKLMWGNDIRE